MAGATGTGAAGGTGFADPLWCSAKTRTSRSNFSMFDTAELPRSASRWSAPARARTATVSSVARDRASERVRNRYSKSDSVIFAQRPHCTIPADPESRSNRDEEPLLTKRNALDARLKHYALRADEIN